MDSLSWNNAETISNTGLLIQPCPWSNQQQQQEMCDNSVESTQGCFFNPCQSSKRVTQMMMEQLMASAFGSINGSAPNLSLLHRHDSVNLGEEMEEGTTWGEEVFNAHLCSWSQINRSYLMNPLTAMVDNFGPPDGFPVSAAKSMESLDCLLSVTDSDKQLVEEDGAISVILSDGKTNLWSLSGGGTISSGESENNESCRGSNNSKREKRKKEEEKLTEKSNYHYFDLLQSDSSVGDGGFRLISENPSSSRSTKRPKWEKHQMSSNISFKQPNSSPVSSSVDEPDVEAIAQVKEMIYRAAAFRPVNLGMEVVEKPKRKNVRISNDPQTVAARQRRERISERIRVLQRLVPGGSKMDTASMLDEAANYLKFLKSQVTAMEKLGSKLDSMNCCTSNLTFPMHNFFSHPNP